ncbi:MAG: insulinase family protein [Acidobacteria bacterium]|nr:insulinase family protein [Acidobacteriota bacterium]
MITLRLTLLLAASAALTLAQVPRPAQSARPKPESAKPATPPVRATPPRTSPAKPAETSFSLPLPDTAPPLAKLPSAAVQSLPNGLRLVHSPNPSLPIVDVYLTVALGHSHDPAGKRGLNRALAHSIRYGGTATRTREQVEEFLNQRQITLQAVAGPELIEWAGRCRSGDLADFLALLGEMFTRPAFRRSAIEDFQAQERFAIQTYGRNIETTADREAEIAWFGPQSPWNRRQTYEEIRAIDRDGILAYYKSHLGPGRVLLGLQGDVDAATALALAVKDFGAWPSTPLPASAPAPLPVPSRKLTSAELPNATSVRLLLVLPWKQRTAERTPAVAAVLGMFAANWEERQPESLAALLKPFASEDARPRIFNGLATGGIPALQLMGAVRPREAIDAAVALWKQVQKLRAETMTPARLDALRRLYLRSLIFQAANPQFRFRLLMQAHALALPAGHFEAIQQAAATLTPADYSRILAEQLNLDAAQLVLLGDEGDYRSAPDSIGFTVVHTKPAPPTEPEYKPDESEASRARALDILAQAATAMGGAERLDAIRDAVWDYEATLTRSSPPVVIKQHNSWLQPRLYRQEQSSPVGSGISYYDGKLGWIHANRALQNLAPLTAQQYRNEVIRLLFRLVRAGGLEGYQVFHGGPALVVIRSPDHYAVELALDFDTHLPERIRFLEQRPNDGVLVRVEERLSDYKVSGGVLMPHRIAVIQDGQQFAEFVMTSIRFNTGLTEEEISRKP